MRVKSPKVYSLAQVEKLLRKGHSTVYGYINAGLIKVFPNKVKGKSGRVGMVVSEAEYERLKRNGVDSTGIKSTLAKLSGSAARKSAKKKVGRGASATVAKKRVKRSATASTPAKKRNAYARGVTKKQVRRNAAAAARPIAKKNARRGATGKTAKKRKK
jgi:predicted DNA-binding transcriptional regulator AlpA